MTQLPANPSATIRVPKSKIEEADTKTPKPTLMKMKTRTDPHCFSHLITDLASRDSLEMVIKRWKLGFSKSILSSTSLITSATTTPSTSLTSNMESKTVLSHSRSHTSSSSVNESPKPSQTIPNRPSSLKIVLPFPEPPLRLPLPKKPSASPLPEPPLPDLPSSLPSSSPLRGSLSP